MANSSFAKSKIAIETKTKVSSKTLHKNETFYYDKKKSHHMSFENGLIKRRRSLSKKEINEKFFSGGNYKEILYLTFYQQRLTAKLSF